MAHQPGGLELAYLALQRQMATLHLNDRDFPDTVSMTPMEAQLAPKPYFCVYSRDETRGPGEDLYWIQPMNSRAEMDIELVLAVKANGPEIGLFMVQKAQAIKNAVRALTSSQVGVGSFKCAAVRTQFAYDMISRAWGAVLITVQFAEYLLSSDG